MDGFTLRQLGLAIALGSSMGLAQAATSNDFVDHATAGGIAEIETSKLALEQSSSADVKNFAEEMIKDHTEANKRLTALAKKLDIEVPDETTLTNQAKAKILEMRDESFDQAYANNQVNAHEDTIELFTKQAESKDNEELRAFAKQTLPTLQHHLQMAKKLQSAHKKDD